MVTMDSMAWLCLMWRGLTLWHSSTFPSWKVMAMVLLLSTWCSLYQVRVGSAYRCYGKYIRSVRPDWPFSNVLSRRFYHYEWRRTTLILWMEPPRPAAVMLLFLENNIRMMIMVYFRDEKEERKGSTEGSGNTAIISINRLTSRCKTLWPPYNFAE